MGFFHTLQGIKGISGEEGDTGTTGEKVITAHALKSRHEKHMLMATKHVTLVTTIMFSTLFAGRYWIYRNPRDAWYTRNGSKEMKIK